MVTGLDLPGNGAPGMMGAIRTIGPSEWSVVDGDPEGRPTAEAIHGDTWFSVIEFSKPHVRAEALLGYGNWSKEGSKHVTDQLGLLSRNEMRAVWRQRSDIEANLERRCVF